MFSRIAVQDKLVRTPGEIEGPCGGGGVEQERLVAV